MVGVVDPAPGIRVLEPGAADVVVLLVDDERNARLLEPVPREQARHSRADDHDPEVGVGRDVGLAPTRCASVLAADREFLLEQREVRGHVDIGGAADRELHDLQEFDLGRRRGGDATTVAESDEGLEREVVGLSELVVGESALRHREQERIRAKVWSQERHVSGEVGERR